MRLAAALCCALLLLAGCDGDNIHHLPMKLVQIERSSGDVIRLGVEVADDPQERETGLMDRDVLPEDRGMLFVFDAPAVQSFWMRNTLIPLDMIFIDADGKIVHLHKDAIPKDETPISSRFPVTKVLEVNAGLITRWDLHEGDIITIVKSAGIN